MAINLISEQTGIAVPEANGAPPSEGIAIALGWQEGTARIQNLATTIPGGTLNVTRAFLGPQPAAVFATNGTNVTHRILQEAARYAYHSSVHWGLIADEFGAVIFNSHWIRDEEWFRLPEISWLETDQHIDLLTAMTPQAVAEGRLDKIASTIREPDRFLMPVDDALVSRLDRWRLEALRYGREDARLDEDLHVLFAQLFVLRAVEDRRLRSDMPALEDAISYDQVDGEILKYIYERARETIQSQLFADDPLDSFPEFALAGIIRDLYIPEQLPRGSQRYNFAWMDADILGRAYEKYLANVYIDAPVPPQMRLFDQPNREVEPISVKKSGGIFYTPEYLVGALTDQAIQHAFDEQEDERAEELTLPSIADFACGSGSFLVEAVSALVRRLRDRDPQRNWARELIEQKRILGIDIDPRAVTLTRMNLWLRLTEEPDALPLPSIEDVVVLGDSLGDEVWADLPGSFDIVLGNPPFVATAGVRSREVLERKFRTAQGRFDYSYLFIELAIGKLAPGGTLGMVVPNRLFRNRDAGMARQIISTDSDLLSIIDFGSNEVFEGTSSYIGAVVAQKRFSPDSEKPSSVRVVLVSDTSDTRYLGGVLIDALIADGESDQRVLSSFEFMYPTGQGPWALLSPENQRNRFRLEQGSVLLGELTGVYQGIRTGANDIFIVAIESYDGIFAKVVNGIGEAAVLEMSLLRPVVFGSDIQRYDLIEPRQMLIYPYYRGSVLTESEFRDLSPKTFAYLSNYRTMLSNRSSITASGLRWYELVRKRDEAWLTSPKLLIRDLATRTSFALDSTGEVFLVGGTAVVPADPQTLLPLLGYLNSSTASEYLAALTPAFRRSFQKFEPQHLNQLPVPRAIADSEPQSWRLGGIVEEVLQSQKSDRDPAMLEAEIDSLILDLISSTESR